MNKMGPEEDSEQRGNVRELGVSWVVMVRVGGGAETSRVRKVTTEIVVIEQPERQWTVAP